MKELNTQLVEVDLLITKLNCLVDKVMQHRSSHCCCYLQKMPVSPSSPFSPTWSNVTYNGD